MDYYCAFPTLGSFNVGILWAQRLFGILILVISDFRQWIYKALLGNVITVFMNIVLENKVEIICTIVINIISFNNFSEK